MTLKSDTTLKKTDLQFQIWHEEFCEFSPNHSKVPKFHFDGLFLSNKIYMRFELKNTEELSFMTLNSEQWCKIWINPDVAVLKLASGIGWTFIGALKSLKNYELMGSFCPNQCFSWKISGIMYHDTEGWCRI